MSIGLALRKNFLPILKQWRWKTKFQSYSSAAIGQKYKSENVVLGYTIKEVEEISELNLTALLLEHKLTGAEHLHLACDDANNLFGVSFRTPPEDSTGIPHILEHLALCGSKRFPCRDPFFNMMNRSLSTFMNAFTGSDMTIYAFSSQNPKDFQNLLSVYLDAAFYPCLHEKDFRQEGWRLEHEDVNNKDSPLVFKGVVFNEMKGVFSDPNQYYARHLQNYLFPSNAYSHESGGDPHVIPNLTWEKLKQFHSKLYHPSNSRFITYGNMPLESHLEKIETLVLGNFEKFQINNQVPEVEPWSKPRELTIYNRFDPMAANPDKQTVISNSFVLNKITDTYENFALSILGTLLVDGPNAPFYQKLLESGVGPDYSPCTGFDASLKQSMFSVGLREIAGSDTELVNKLIAETFDEVINKGFPEEQINAVLHRVEMATKHRTSNFGLNCALGVSSMWNHNGNPISAFKVNNHVQWFLGQQKGNPHFLQDKVVQYFKNNNHKLTLIMKPTEDFEEKQQKQMEMLLQSKLNTLTDSDRLKIYHEGLELVEHQKNMDASCLPTLRIDEVKRDLERTPLKFTSIGDVSVQLCEQPTNEVVYFRAIADASFISEEDLMLLPLFTSVITQMGAGGLNYKEFDQEAQLKTSGLSISLHISEHPSDPFKFQQVLTFSSRCLERNVDAMFSLWEKIINNPTLEDRERLNQLIKMEAAELAQSITHRGHAYAMKRAASSLSECGNRKEKVSGLTQIDFMKKLAEKDNHEEVLERLKHLSKILFHKSSMKCSLNATPTFMPSALNSLDSFLGRLKLSTDASTSVSKKNENCHQETKSTHFILPFSVNYIGQCILSVPFSHPDYPSLKVAAKLLTSRYLHAEIREKGGAYGGGAQLSKAGHFTFYSYRDPNVSKTLDAFSSGIDWLLAATYSDQDIDEAKLGIFSEIDSPVPPGSKGSAFFFEEVSDDMKEAMRKGIFDCTREDLLAVTKKYLKDSQQSGTALIGPENQFTKSKQDTWTIVSN